MNISFFAEHGRYAELQRGIKDLEKSRDSSAVTVAPERGSRPGTSCIFPLAAHGRCHSLSKLNEAMVSI